MQGLYPLYTVRHNAGFIPTIYRETQCRVYTHYIPGDKMQGLQPLYTRRQNAGFIPTIYYETQCRIYTHCILRETMQGLYPLYTRGDNAGFIPTIYHQPRQHRLSQATTPLNERRASLAVNGTRAPLRRKLRDQPELACKAPKTNPSPKGCI